MNQTIFAGVDVGGTFVKIGLVTKEGQILVQTQIPTQAEKPAAEMLKRAAATSGSQRRYADNLAG